MANSEERKRIFQKAIVEFIKTEREEKNDSTAGKYDYLPWLEDKAKRVGSIQMVTHPLKATHPDAHINKTTSLFRPLATLSPQEEIGSHSIDKDYRDVSGDAAALGVYRLLKIEVEGIQLIDWFQNDDPDLISALHTDEVIAKKWAQAFKDLIRPIQPLISYTNAKQVYWCCGNEPTLDSDYHLLQPLFSSSLAHAVHQELNDARYDKEVRQAYYTKAPHTAEYRQYRDLAVRKLGGTKSLNVSQLNAERRGVNYLLSSQPPQWKQDRPRNFLSIESAFDRFRWYEGVDDLLSALIRFLKSNADPTMEARVKRESIEQALGETLAAFGIDDSEQSLEPGWTRDSQCRLPFCEQLWLDPGRAELPFRPEHVEEDNSFKQAFVSNDWQSQIADRFGKWINAALKNEGLPVGDVEHAHWAKQAILDTMLPSTMPSNVLRTNNAMEAANG